MKTHQRALQEWLENRIKFKTWFSKNTIHTIAVFDIVCKNHLRGGPVADKLIWRKPTDVHDAILRVVQNLRRNGLLDARIDAILDGFFSATNLLACADDKDVIALLRTKAAVWKKEGRS